MRSDAEIIDRIKAVKADDWMGTQSTDLICCLPFEAAKPWLKETATPEGWETSSREIASVRDRIHEYMNFAWGKANNCRGISAARSLDHMKSWLWLAGEDDFLRRLGGLEDYTHYGKPQLRAVCEHFGWDWRQWDDGKWRNEEAAPCDRPEDVPVAGAPQ